jgi:hypothetical protein
MLCLAAFLCMLCLAASISSYSLIVHQHDVMTTFLSLAARVHNAIPIMYALLHCRCKSRSCLAFNLDNFTGIRSRESPSPQGCKGMLVAKLKMSFRY